MVLKILIACEESQRVCMAFREKGHEAYSCDILPCSGGHPEWHIQGDVLPFLNGASDDFYCRIDFYTQDGVWHELPWKWDMIVAFPPCTHLCVSGARHFEKKRFDGRQRAGIEFFIKFLNANCDKIAVENPVGIISGDYIIKWFPDLAKKYNLPIKPTQKIQPYEYGHSYTKTTCLWLKGLPMLKPTEILIKPLNGWQNQCFTKSGRYGGFSSNFRNPIERSKTFPGIAKAMSEQWG